MNILWRFPAPFTPFGYGVVTREMVPFLINDGHKVVVSTHQYIGPPMKYGNMTVISDINGAVSRTIMEEEGGYYFHIVNYKVENEFPPEKYWVACAGLDFEFADEGFANRLKRSVAQFTTSKHGQNELKRLGYNATYAPWGINMELFHPSPTARGAFRTKLGVDEDTFVIGTVGANSDDDRKNYINLIKAFQIFSQRHLDSVLYLHTSLSNNNLGNLIRFSGLSDRIKFPDQKELHLYNIPYESMVETYNGFDVFIMPSKGEAYCMPLVEAQSCGIPAIVTETTALKENCIEGWQIPVTEDDLEPSPWGPWWYKVRPTAIVEQMELAYKKWENDKFLRLKKDVRKGILHLEINQVFNNYWVPFLKELEEKCPK